MAYAILGVSKLKTHRDIISSENHSYRKVQVKNADPTRRHLNRTLIGASDNVSHHIESRISEVTDKRRKNGVMCIEHMLTASPEFFDGKSEEEILAWAQSSIMWLKQNYGERNLVHAVLHRDETTPHVAAYVVPELNGKMNARGIMGNKQLMKDLHTKYAAAMKPYGLIRGVEGSQATHQTLKRFYGRVNEVAAKSSKAVAQLGEPTPPPEHGILASRATRQASREAWRGKEKGRTARMVQYTARASLTATIALDENKQLKAASSALTAENEKLKEELAVAYRDLGLTKEDISALRKADISLVAQRLGYMEEIKPKENPIDLVKRIGGFSYEQAVAWLHAELGPVMTGALVAKSVEQASPPRPLTKAENVIKQAIIKQTDALGCDKYRLSIIPERENGKPYLPGKPGGKASTERFYTREDLINLISWLRYENNQQKHIYVTPMDDHAYYVLLDDPRISKHELEKRGFQPCLVQKTSWEKEQILFKVPQSVPREAVLELFNKLNKAVGDEKINALRHPIRLAGFRNMKAKHERNGQRPFVQVTMAMNRFCQRCTHLASGFAAKVKVELGLTKLDI